MYTYMCMSIYIYRYIHTCDLGFTFDTLDTFDIFEYMCIYIYTYCDLTIYHHNHTIQHAVGPHQVSWLDVLAQASPGSGRAVDLRTSLAIWLLWPGPHIGSGYPYPFAFRSPTFCLPAWSIFGHLPCLERP